MKKRGDLDFGICPIHGLRCNKLCSFHSVLPKTDEQERIFDEDIHHLNQKEKKAASSALTLDENLEP